MESHLLEITALAGCICYLIHQKLSHLHQIRIAETFRINMRQIDCTVWDPSSMFKWLSFLSPNENILEQLEPLLQDIHFDGDCLVVAEELLGRMRSQIQCTDNEWKTFLEKLRDELLYYQQNEEELIRTIVKIESNVKPFPKYEDMPAAKASILYYHRKTWNAEGSSARAYNRNWANQPAIIRRWLGCHVTCLSTDSTQFDAQVNQPFMSALPRRALTMNFDTMSQLFYFSMACSGRKDNISILGSPLSSWTKRCHASSGGLHPVECHFISKRLLVESDRTGAVAVYHYNTKFHGLETRRIFNSKHALESVMPDNAFLLCLTSMNWREIWKYGERGFRYSQLDIGHALSAISISALQLGWDVIPINVIGSRLTDTFMEKFLHLNTSLDPNFKTEIEDMAIVCIVTSEKDQTLRSQLVKEFERVLLSLESESSADWLGVPKRTSYYHSPWEVVELVTTSTKNVDFASKSETQKEISLLDAYDNTGTATSTNSNNGSPILVPNVTSFDNSTTLTIAPTTATKSFSDAVRSRRSALRYADFHSDNTKGTRMTKDNFLEILSSTVPHLNSAYWNNICTTWGTQIHLCIYVIQVEGLQSGYYVLFRSNNSDVEEAMAAMKSGNSAFLWEQPNPNLSLFALAYDDAASVGKKAMGTSCYQEIARTSSLVITMFTPLVIIINTLPPVIYRQLHWECGMIGQLLYLEAVSHNYTATGIGCFLDDIVLESFGLSNTDNGSIYASLYNFSIGVPTGEKERYDCYDYQTSMFELVQDEFDFEKYVRPK